ncbi:MAG: hypothetical protein EBR79_01315 [Proteobacteria bacterium]|nr:hypothetical protein [Pseudomonadota bacterium]
MRVSEIRDRIVELSHASTGDGEVQAKALGWLNAAYGELMNELMPYMPAALQVQEQLVTNTAGVAVVAREIYRAVRVVERNGGGVLEVVVPEVILAADPLGNATGNPVRCVVRGREVQVHPAAEVPLSVLYVPAVQELLENGEEAAVLLPASHHSALVWGGLVWSSLFERGFGGSGEMGVYRRQWEEAKQRVKLALLGNAGEALRVKPFELV